MADSKIEVHEGQCSHRWLCKKDDPCHVDILAGGFTKQGHVRLDEICRRWNAHEAMKEALEKTRARLAYAMSQTDAMELEGAIDTVLALANKTGE